MNIPERTEQLQSILLSLDERLEDFRDLINDSISYQLDYSLESIKYVELVLKNMLTSLKEDKDLQQDVSFYIGETIYRSEPTATWEVYDGDAIDYSGSPCVKIDDKILFPFLATKEFIKKPEIGVYLNQIKAIVDL